MDKLIGLAILKVYIKRILNLLTFICFLFHVNVFCSFLRYGIFKFQYSNSLAYWYLYGPKFENWSMVIFEKAVTNCYKANCYYSLPVFFLLLSFIVVMLSSIGWWFHVFLLFVVCEVLGLSLWLKYKKHKGVFHCL